MLKVIFPDTRSMCGAYMQIAMEQVVLPVEQKDMLLTTVDNFAKFREYRKKAGLEDVISYGAGLVIMLCGASGTGKTMTVNAVAHHLGESPICRCMCGIFGNSITYIISRPPFIKNVIGN